MSISTDEESSDLPLALPYRDAPIGDVVATEAALQSLRKTRPWAMACAIGMFVYALIGGGLGTMWLIVWIRLANNPGEGKAQFAILVPPNLIGSMLALVGGWLAMRYYMAAGRAYYRRSSEDLERALVAQARIWRWAAVTVAALFAMPFIIVGLGLITGAMR